MVAGIKLELAGGWYTGTRTGVGIDATMPLGTEMATGLEMEKE